MATLSWTVPNPISTVAALPAAGMPPISAQAELVARAQTGDADAFAVLFQQHKKRVYSLCFLMTNDVADAEDLTQEAFIQVFRKLGTFRGESAFSTWLYRVAVNTVLMSLRRRKPREVSLDEPIWVDHASVPRDFGRSDPKLSGTVERIALARALGDLPEGYRTIFILHEVEGYQHREIAKLLHCSVGNSKSQLHKAKLRLSELLFVDKKNSSRPVTACPSQRDAPFLSRRPRSRSTADRSEPAEAVLIGPIPMVETAGCQ